MLKQLVVKLIGFCLTFIPILSLIRPIFKLGFSKLFYVKDRLVAPKCLTNGKYGRSQWAKLATGIKMHYVEKGDKGKPLMLFIHGFPEFWFSWRYQLEHFSKDFWCVAPDLRGYNETSKPTGIENYSVDSIVDDVKCLIHSLGRKKCVLVGHDWGGAIGYSFCGKYPEMASQYIVCNLPHPSSLGEQWKSSPEQALKSWYILFFQCPYIPEIYFRTFDMGIFDAMFKDLKDPVDPEIIEAYKYAFRDKETVTSAINYYRNSVQFGVDLESLFFDAEVAMEGNVCRDLASSIQQEELIYLQQIAELLLFLLLPKPDFLALPLRSLTREILVNFVLKPMLEHLSDPDFINQTIVWILKDNKIKPDVFLSAIRCSENLDELTATREMVTKDIGTLRSKDSEGEKNSSLKQQLNSLLYLRKVIDNRIHRLQGEDSDSFGVPSQVDWNQTVSSGVKLFVLPVDVILKNSIALSYFIDFMTSIGCQSYLFFYLNVEGWKVSAEQNIQAVEIEDLRLQERVRTQALIGSKEREALNNDIKLLEVQRNALMENMREAAHSIYEEYLSEKSNPRLKIEESVIRRLILKIRTESLDPEWFDESQATVFEKLQTEERFLDAFRRCMGYVKLLAELDLLKDPSNEDDDDGQSSLAGDEFSIYDSLSVNSSDGSSSASPNILTEEKRAASKDDLLQTGNNSNFKTHRRSASSISSRQSFQDIQPLQPHQKIHQQQQQQLHQQYNQHHQQPQQPKSFLKTEVVEFAIAKDGVKSYAVYTIIVSYTDERGCEEVRQVFRRYSDFHALHEKICSKYDRLVDLPFPSKKTFGNMERHVLENRRKMLDQYLKSLLEPSALESNLGLIILMNRFLDQTSYESERGNQSMNVLKAVGSVKNSVKNVTHAVTSVPNNLINTVDSVMDGITKALQGKPGIPVVAATGKVGAELNSDPSDNIPLRIMLLFMDEVFDLQERNQWLRRQIVSVLRQLVKAMFGDIVNRRIVDYFAQMTSPEMISSYLQSLKQTWWPDGYPAAPQQPRDEATKNRTRVAARAALLSSFSDDLRRVIGLETARSGLLMMFDMLQHPVLNKRLAIVMLEGIVQTLFHEQDFKMIFQRLHSRSNRIRNELKNSQRKFVDIRR